MSPRASTRAAPPSIAARVPPPANLRLRLDSDALVANWRWLQARADTACGAAVKADGYGLGARAAVDRLAAAGCRDFFVSTWAEAAALGDWPDGLALSVLHGVSADELPFARAHKGRPVLNSVEQVARWRGAASGPCDVMVDTGMNRLGLRPEEAQSGVLDGLAIATLMSHLACADEPGHPMNAAQLAAFRALVPAIPAERRSLANSGGVCMGRDYAFDLVRPGLALYGGIPREEAVGGIRPVVGIEALVVQTRTAAAGESVGYGATWHAPPGGQRLAILNIGYADGYLRSFAGRGRVVVGDGFAPIVGRVSMDLIAVALPAGAAAREGDWLALDYDLPRAAAQSGLSQYELLTGLGARYGRAWT